MKTHLNIKTLTTICLPALLCSCSRKSELNPFKDVDFARMFPILDKIKDLTPTIIVIVMIAAFVFAVLAGFKILRGNSFLCEFTRPYDMTEDRFAISCLLLCATCVLISGIMTILYLVNF